MNHLIKSVAVLLGADPRKPQPDDFTPEAKSLHAEQRADKSRIEAIRIEIAHKKQHKTPEKWRRRRWTVLILVNLLFVLSFQLDIQMLEGALTASRFVGFHMADLNSALQVMLAYKEVVINLVIGMSPGIDNWGHVGGLLAGTLFAWSAGPVCQYSPFSPPMPLRHRRH